MTYAAQTFVDSIDIGSFLKIYSSNGVYNNLSTASDIWKMILKMKARDPGGRKLKYLLRTGYGPAAVQSLGAGSAGSYPAAQRSGLGEGTAEYKEYAMTVNVPRNLLNKTGNDLVQYADPLTEELDGKSIVAARIMSAQAMGDGSGAIGVVSTASVSTSTDYLTIVLSTSSANAGQSHVGWFEIDDKCKFANEDGTAQNVTSTGGTPSYYKVVSRDDDTDTVVFAVYNSSDVRLTDITAANEIEAGDRIYRFGTTPNDVDSISTNDYNTLSECLVGLESLSADDGRLVNGITHSGTTSGTRRDVGGAAIDSSDFQKALSKAKRRCGKGRYKYNKAFMFDTVYDALVESRETDRRFQSVEDGKRGVKMLGYQHAADFVEFIPDEFTSKQRVWILPDSKEVLEFHGKDFELVEPNKGQKFHLKPGSANASHTREMQAYMEGSGTIICKHPAALCVITNFTAA